MMAVLVSLFGLVMTIAVAVGLHRVGALSWDIAVGSGLAVIGCALIIVNELGKARR